MSEFPDEISLCADITNCCCNCKGCSMSHLKKDIGTPLTNEEIDKLIKGHPDITVFGIMGGDREPNDVIRVADYIHENYPNIKVGMYSGRDYMLIELMEHLDIYKVGRWISPEGPVNTWQETNCGPLVFPWSNQIYFEKVDGKLVNSTYKFRKNPIGNPERYIIKEENN